MRRPFDPFRERPDDQLLEPQRRPRRRNADRVGPLTLKVFRKVADPASYQVVGRDTRDLIPATLNTFQARLPVQPGDVIGTSTAQPATTACTFSDPGETFLLRMGNLAASMSTYPTQANWRSRGTA